MEIFWQQLWDKGIPLFILCIGIFTLWKAWRFDTENASKERQKMVESIDKLGDRFERLERKISDFFLSKFPSDPI